MTATVSSRLSRLASWPVSTRPVTSLARSTFVGRTARSINPAGAIELPPESEAREPISVASEPSAPARWMRVHRVVRVVAGVVLGARRDHGAVDASRRGRRHAVEDAAQERAVAVEREAEPRVREAGRRSPGSSCPAACRPAGPACRSRRCSGSRAARLAPPISTFEPTMLAPPARSMQMNGILPAPCTSMPQVVFRAWMSGDKGRHRRTRIREQAEDGRRRDRGESRCRSPAR